MNITSYVTDVTSTFSKVPPTAYPALLWSWYIEYLWNYESDSWVGRIAYASRAMAFVLCLPTLILGLLDVASYVIARTLGIVDDVKASTSDQVSQVQSPVVHIEPAESGARSTIREKPAFTVDSASEDNDGTPQPQEFFATEKNLKLSGVGILSPAATRPPSPVLMRKNLNEEPSLRHRPQQATERDG